MALVDLIDFGHNDAKRDHNLSQYFMDQGWLSALRNGKKFFIFGRKGAGKTALALQLKEIVTDEYDGFAELLSFKSFAAQQLLRFKDRNFLPPNEYQTFWRYLLLLEITKLLLLNLSLESTEDLQVLADFLKKNYHDTKISSAKIIKETVDLGFKVGLPEKFSGAGIELKRGKTKEYEARIAYNRIVDELEKKVFAAATTGKYFVILDELDDIYDGSEDYRSLVVSLLKVAADINSHLTAKSLIRIVVCLRTDIVNQLRDSDLNKYEDDRIDLNWIVKGKIENSPLRYLVNLRIAASTALKVAEDPWSRVFSAEKIIRTHQDPFRFIIERTLHRPRDIIQFCKECQKVAVGKERIHPEHAWEAEKNYSEWFKKELIDEIYIEVPEVKVVYDVLRKIQKATFETNEFIAEASKRKELATNALDDLLHTLFRFSIVGNSYYPRRGPRKLFFAFRSELDDITLDLGKAIVVNRALWRGLNLY